MTLQDLLVKVEAAEGGSRELDGEIATTVGDFYISGERYGKPAYCRLDEQGRELRPGQSGDMMVPRYTTSLDAAVALVEAKLPDRLWSVAKRQEPYFGWGTYRASVYREDDINRLDDATGHAPTPALSLIGALLKALISQEQSQ